MTKRYYIMHALFMNPANFKRVARNENPSFLLQTVAEYFWSLSATAKSPPVGAKILLHSKCVMCNCSKSSVSELHVFSMHMETVKSVSVSVKWRLQVLSVLMSYMPFCFSWCNYWRHFGGLFSVLFLVVTAQACILLLHPSLRRLVMSVFVPISMSVFWLLDLHTKMDN